jgi:hypothetical protein
MKRLAFLFLLATVPVMSAEPVIAPAAAVAPVTPQPAIKPVQPPTAPTTKPTTKPTAGKSVDRLELGATQITGNQELPKVMYVVPWKRSDLGDLTGRPANSLLDEVLAPVDRDVFRRQNRYYDALRPDTGKSGSGTAQP